jgi:hypothetical protein
VKTTMTKTIGLTSISATCFGAPVVAALPVAGLFVADLPMTGDGRSMFHEERPMSAPVAAAAAANHGLAYAAAGAGNHRSAMRQSDQQHSMWAFRGPGPWKERP